MKKLLTILSIICMMFLTNVYALENEYIKSIECENTYKGETLKLDVETEGLSIKAKDAKFYDINDNLKCKLVIKNPTEKNIIIDDVKYNQQSDDNIEYILKYDDSKEIKPSEEKSYELEVIYKKLLEDGKEIDSKLEINFIEDEEIENPKTGPITYIFLYGIIISFGVLLGILKYKNIGPFKYHMFLFLIMFMIPVIVNAINGYKIELNNKIIINVDKYYQVTIDPNGGKYNGSTIKYVASVISGTEIDLSDIVKANAKFESWTLNGTDKYTENKITITKDTTLVANWKNKYTVTIDPNGGKFNGSSEISEIEAYDGDIIDLSDIVHDTYDFSHWQKDGSEKYTKNKITVNGNISLKAMWDRKFNVVIDPNGGKFNGSSEVYRAKVSEGTVIDLTDAKNGIFALKNWKLNETETYRANTITVDKDITLVANWVDAVARIEQKYYETIMDAENDAVTDDVIHLLKSTREIVTNEKKVTLNLEGFKVTGSLTNTDAGNITIINGIIENPDGPAVINNGILNLGINDTKEDGTPNVSIDSVALIGTINGIQNNKTFNFYDGYIEGDIAIKGGYDDTPIDYTVFVEHNTVKDCQKAYLVPIETARNRAVAKTIVGGTIYYHNLQDGFDAGMASDMDVYAIRMFEATYKLHVPEGEEVLFDLDGFYVQWGNEVEIEENAKLTLTDRNSIRGTLAPSVPIINRGTLNIDTITIWESNDSNMIENYGTIKFNNGVLNAKAGASIYNHAGRIELTSTANLYSSNVAILNDSSEETYVTGGNIYGIKQTGTGTLTVEKSKIIGYKDGITVDSTGKIVVDNTSSNVVYHSSYSYGLPNGVKISGGGVVEIKNNSNISSTTGNGILVQKGTLDLKDSEVSSQRTGIFFNQMEDGESTITNSTIKASDTTSNDAYAVYITYDNYKVNINNSNLIAETYGKAYGINIQVNNYNRNEIINTSTIKNTNITAKGNTSGYGINFPSETNTSTKYKHEYTIEGGKIEGSTYGVYKMVTGSTLTIGKNDETVSETSPEIIGDTYGLYVGEGVVNFYDGIFKGKTAAYYGLINNIPEEYKIVDKKEVINNATYFTRLLKVQQNFVKVGSNQYMSLKSAIDSIETEGEIEFINDGGEAIEIEIPSTKTIVIDFKGYSYDNNKTITNNGTLTLKSTGAKNGEISFNTTENLTGILNKGQLTIDKMNLNIDSSLAATLIKNQTYRDLIITNSKLSSRSETQAAIAVESSGSGTCSVTPFNKLEISDSEITTVGNKAYNAISSDQYMKITDTKITANKLEDTSTISVYAIYSNCASKVSELTGSEIYGNCNGVGRYIKVDDTYFEINNPASDSYAINTTSTVTNSEIKMSGSYPKGIKATSISNTTININATSEATGIMGANNVTGCTINVTGPKAYGVSNVETVTNNTIKATGTTEGYAVKFSNYSNVSVLNGTYEGSTAGLYYASSDSSKSLTIGTKDGNINITNPVFIGDKYGVQVASGVVNFYDGIFKGKEEALSGVISGVETSASISRGQDGAYKTKFLVIQGPFVRVNGNEYTSLQTAINNISSTGTVEFFDNAVENKIVNIPNGKNITIDLKGYEYNVTKITSNGTLTIIDNGIEKGKLSFEPATNNFGLEASTSYGNLTIDGVNIESSQYGVSFRGAASTEFNLKNSNVTALNNALSVNGNDSTSKVKDSTLTTTNSSNAVSVGLTKLNMTNTNVIANSLSNGTAITLSGSMSSMGVYTLATLTTDNVNVTIQPVEGASANGLSGITVTAGALNFINSKIISPSIGVKNNGTIFASEVLLKDSEIKIDTTEVPYGINDQTANTKVTVDNVKFNIKTTAPTLYGIQIYPNANKVKDKHTEYIIKDSDIILEGQNSFPIYVSTQSASKIGDGSITTTILSGTLKGSIYGAYLYGKNNKIVIGNDEDSINKNTPVIMGDTYGVYLGYNSTGYFYDGTVKGRTDAFYGDVSRTATDGYIVYSTEKINDVDYYIRYPEPETYIVQNGSKKYINLETAVFEAANGDTLKLLKNTHIYYDVEINNNKTINIDLNDYNLSTNGKITVDLGSTLNMKNTGTKDATFETNLSTSYIYCLGTLNLDNINYKGNLINSTAYESITLNNVKGTGMVLSASQASGNLTIKNSTINGAMNVYGNATIENSSFENNTIYLNNASATLNLKNTTKAGLYVYAGTVNVSKDADYTEELIVAGLTLNSGSATVNGATINGTLVLNNTTTTATIKNAKITNIVTNKGILDLENVEVVSENNLSSTLTMITNTNTITSKNLKVNYLSEKSATAINNTGTIGLNGNNTINMVCYTGSTCTAINTTGAITGNKLDITTDSKNIYTNFNIVTVSTSGKLELDTLNIKANENSYRKIVYGINSQGTTEFKHGTIDIYSSYQCYAVYIAGGTTTIGEAESSTSPNYETENASVSIEDPLIKGTATYGYGVYRYNGIFNYLDGKLMGTSSGKLGTVSLTEKYFEPTSYYADGYNYWILEYIKND